MESYNYEVRLRNLLENFLGDSIHIVEFFTNGSNVFYCIMIKYQKVPLSQKDVLSFGKNNYSVLYIGDVFIVDSQKYFELKSEYFIISEKFYSTIYNYSETYGEESGIKLLRFIYNY